MYVCALNEVSVKAIFQSQMSLLAIEFIMTALSHWNRGVYGFLVALHDTLDPAVVTAHAGVDTGVAHHSTLIAPGDHTLQLATAHQRSARVTLYGTRRRTPNTDRHTHTQISHSPAFSHIQDCTSTENKLTENEKHNLY